MNQMKLKKTVFAHKKWALVFMAAGLLGSAVHASPLTPIAGSASTDIQTLAQARSDTINGILAAFSAQLNAQADPQQAANELSLGLHKLGDAQLAQAGEIAQLSDLHAFVSAALRMPAMTKSASNTGMVFVPIAPCRIVDSRGGNKLALNEARPYYAYAALGQGGNSACAAQPLVAPGTQAALAVTITATEGSVGGYMSVGPNATSGGTSTINFPANTNIANSTVIKLSGDPSSADFYVMASKPVHVLVDVLGYYAAAAPEALECNVKPSAPKDLTAFSTHVTVDAPACDAGYSRTAVYCNSDRPNVLELRAVTPSSCVFMPGSGNGVASSNCCRVPGN